MPSGDRVATVGAGTAPLAGSPPLCNDSPSPLLFPAVPFPTTRAPHNDTSGCRECMAKITALTVGAWRRRRPMKSTPIAGVGVSFPSIKIRHASAGWRLRCTKGIIPAVSRRRRSHLHRRQCETLGSKFPLGFFFLCNKKAEGSGARPPSDMAGNRWPSVGGQLASGPHSPPDTWAAGSHAGG